MTRLIDKQLTQMKKIFANLYVENLAKLNLKKFWRPVKDPLMQGIVTLNNVELFALVISNFANKWVIPIKIFKIF